MKKVFYKRVVFWVSMLMISTSIFGCGKKAETDMEMQNNSQTNRVQDETISLENIQQEQENRDSEDQEVPSSSMEVGELSQLSFSINETDSIRNSNLVRFGYLTQAESGRIYYVEFEENAIYAANSDGSEKNLICDDIGTCLQVEGEYLYYKSEQGGIRRVHTENLLIENLVEENTGEFIIKDGRIYVNAPDGFSVYNLDGTGKEVLFEGYEPVMINSAGEDFLFIRTSGTDISMYMKGYLVDYNLSSGELYTVAEKIWYPVVAGSYLSYMDADMGFRQIYNTATGEIADLQIYAESAVSNGTDFYCVDNRADHVCITHWNGESTEIFDEFTIERTENDYLYLSADYLYLLQQYVQDGVTYSDWSCYNLETGERSTL